MAVEQGVVWCRFDWEAKSWTATMVDGRAFEGHWDAVLGKLSADAWEVITVTPMQWKTEYRNNAVNALSESLTDVILLAMTVQRVP
jgi:hypothetical protein